VGHGNSMSGKEDINRITTKRAHRKNKYKTPERSIKAQQQTQRNLDESREK
jgi:hypothetical protein